MGLLMLWDVAVVGHIWLCKNMTSMQRIEHCLEARKATALLIFFLVFFWRRHSAQTVSLQQHSALLQWRWSVSDRGL